MPIVRVNGIYDELITSDLFGANILATTDNIGPAGTYGPVIERLGVSDVRYPGGALAEQFFDITDPTRDTVESVVTGQAVSFIPYDDFMNWAENNGYEVTIVVPTLTQLGGEADADENGDRFPDIDEQALRTFISDTLDGVYGSPEIGAFEIGNEYYGSGQMSSVEYGRVASRMAQIIRNEIDSHPLASSYAETDVLIQMGYNYGSAALDKIYNDVGTPEEQLSALEQDYGMEFPPDKFLFSNGEISWARVNSALVAREFDTPDELQSVDAIVAHVYGRGLDAPNSWYFDYRVIDQVMTEKFPEATKYVTEWNTKSNNFTSEDAEIYGLDQAHEMLHIIHAMTEYGVEAAHVWPVQQNTATDLSGAEGESELTVAGEMFRIMAENLPGTHSVDLDGSSPSEDEVVTLDSDYWLFSGPERSSLFILANDNQNAEISLDLSEVFSDTGTIGVQKLGVQPGESPESRDARPDLQELDPTQILTGLTADVTLGPKEILHISFENPTYVAPFGALVPGYVPPDNPGAVTGEDGDGSQNDGIIYDDYGNILEDLIIYDDYGNIIGDDGEPSGDGASDSFDDENDGGDFGGLLGALMLLPLLMALGR